MRRRTSAIAGAALLALAFTTLTAPAANAADVTHLISDVQGDAATTPLAGTVVTVQGVVTGDYRNATASGYRGFYLQDPTGDPTDARSDGIFVFASSANPAIAIGDLV